MKLQWNILHRLSGNNRGSGIVVVLVSMTCIALMGASLLFMSYTAVRMRATERQASKDFYSAETAMDEIRAGAQSIASDALGRAYKTVLLTYSEGGQVNEDFAEAYVEELEASNLLTLSGTSYDLDVLKAYVSTPPSGVVDVYCPDVTPIAVKDHSGIITLKNIFVEYTADNGYTTTISTDISFGRPDFAYILSGNSLTGLPEHALIANDTLKHTAGESSIDITGSAYVGKMDLQSAGSQLTISNGTLVCANDASISGKTTGGRLVTSNNVKLWAGRIKVSGGGTLTLNGETRVQDDLELAGGKSSATLTGSYYGFGDGTTPTSTDIPANYSSAILINGLDCTLDISGLNHLMLAGRSYISDSLYSSHTGNAERVGMLESIAVRSNQQMYLFDPAVLEVDLNNDGYFETVDQNPFITTDTGLLEKNADGTYKRIRLTNEEQQKAANNYYKLTARQYAFPGGQQVVYCFMEFTKLNAVNTYFEELHTKNSSHINSYLVNDTDTTAPIVVEYSNLNASGSNTYGYSLRGENGSYTLSQPTRTQFYPSGMRSTFNQLKKTLIDANTRVDENTTPYTYIVDTRKVNELADNVEKKFYLDGNLVGVVVDGPYSITGSTPSTMRLVIASGDVAVSADYNGLIISGKSIILTGYDVDIVHDDDGVVAAFNAIADGNPRDSLGTYLLRGVNDGEDTVESGGEEGWDLDALVTYKNWTKN